MRNARISDSAPKAIPIPADSTRAGYGRITASGSPGVPHVERKALAELAEFGCIKILGGNTDGRRFIERGNVLVPFNVERNGNALFAHSARLVFLHPETLDPFARLCALLRG